MEKGGGAVLGTVFSRLLGLANPSPPYILTWSQAKTVSDVPRLYPMWPWPSPRPARLLQLSPVKATTSQASGNPYLHKQKWQAVVVILM